jgi:Putative endonuclease, protein of unknown function (DUF1780)
MIQGRLMPSNDRQYIADLQRHATESRTLFSNAKKPERERMVVRAFLRCTGVPFSDAEIQTSKEEPIDVLFGAARFQVMGILGGRKPGQDWRDREERYKAAERISDLLEPWTPSTPITFGEVAQEIVQSLADKAARYGVSNCSQLDALVYVDLHGRHLWPLEATLEAKTADELTRHAWRSVSMVFLPYGAVLIAKPAAPQWLKDKEGRILREWPGPDGWFDA